MPTLRERLTELIGGPALRQERQQVQRAVTTLIEAQKFRRDPESLVAELQEYDSAWVDWVLSQRGWDTISGRLTFFGTAWSEGDRLREVENSRYMAHWDTQTRADVRAWTNFGFGRSLEVTPVDPNAIEVWNEFWTARRNKPILAQRRIHTLSDRLVTDGEFVFTFWTGMVGGNEPLRTTVRVLGTDEISEVITVEDDPMIPLYYVQTQTNGKQIYYPDWQADELQLETVAVPDRARVAGGLRENTSVVALHVAFDEVDGRGWPLFYTALEWFRAYKDFLGDRAAVSKAVAMFVDKIRFTGGTRARDQMVAALTSSLTSSGSTYETNPPPVAGSTWMENQMLERSRMPLTTGAKDAQVDGMTILGAGKQGTGVPLGFSRPDAFQNRSVAEVTMLPWDEQMERYQSFWRDIFGDVCEVVLLQSGREFETYESVVTLNVPARLSLELITRLYDALANSVVTGAFDQEMGQAAMGELLVLALSSLGVDDPRAALEPEARVEGAVTTALQAAEANYRDGSVSAEQLAEYALGLLLEDKIDEVSRM